jgi:hypothetical protein
LRRYPAIVANHAIVADIDIVANFGPATNFGVVHHAAYDCATDANLNFIANVNASHVWKEMKAGVTIAMIGHSRAANDRVILNDATCANGAPSVNYDMMTYSGIITNCNVFAYNRKRPD